MTSRNGRKSAVTPSGARTEWEIWRAKCGLGVEESRLLIGMSNGAFYRMLARPRLPLTVRYAMAAIYHRLRPWEKGQADSAG